MKAKRILSTAMALLPAASLPLSVLAEEYDLAKGSIEVTASENGNQYVTQTNGVTNEQQTTAIVITRTDKNTATQNTVPVKTEKKQTAAVTRKDVNIDVSGTGDYYIIGSAAVSVEGAGSVTIELEGGKTARSGHGRSWVEKNNEAA